MSHPDAGTPQGGVDLAAAGEHLPARGAGRVVREGREAAAAGRAFMIRYADDVVLVFESEDGRAPGPGRAAEAIRQVRPDAPSRQDPACSTSAAGQRDQERPAESRGFDFLGFTHYWAKSRQRLLGGEAEDGGESLPPGADDGGRVDAGHSGTSPWREQHEHLVSRLRGHDNYYGLQGNSDALSRFHFAVTRALAEVAGPPLQRGIMSWERFDRLLKRYPLPAPGPPELASRSKPVT